MITEECCNTIHYSARVYANSGMGLTFHLDNHLREERGGFISMSEKRTRATGISHLIVNTSYDLGRNGECLNKLEWGRDGQS